MEFNLKRRVPSPLREIHGRRGAAGALAVFTAPLRLVLLVACFAAAAVTAAGCGDDDGAPAAAEAAAAPESGDPGLPAAEVVPVVAGARVTSSDFWCPSQPDRCIRRIVVVDPTARDDDALVDAQARTLARAGWTRVRVCGSDVVQFEDHARKVEAFPMSGRSILRRGEASAGTGGAAEEPGLDALRRAVDARQAVVAMDLAEAFPGDTSC
ncbi:MAG TPA: hypothetical protein VN238_15730 [Solirubrobacteraceae bacterium]|nr:hypothetical protein [Solirubrobacteraceae bacterium]